MFKEKINFENLQIDKNAQGAIERIENAGHVLCIRYLLSKRYNPATIVKELNKLGLSSPSTETLIAYFQNIIWPSVEKFELQEIYSSYYSKIMAKNRRDYFEDESLIYRKVFKNQTDLSVRFMKFCYFLDIHSMWANELTNFHGSVKRLPSDTDGTPIFDELMNFKDPTSHGVELILQNPSRFEIDQMILEDLSNKQIIEYMRKELGIDINYVELVMYKKMFFNVKAQSLEEKITLLVEERNILKNTLDLVKNSGEHSKSSVLNSDRIAIITTTENRIKQLDTNITLLNAKFNEIASRIVATREYNKEDMLKDVMTRAYKRFSELDNFKDRGVVKPLLDLTRIIIITSDKLDESAQNTGSSIGREAEEVMIDLIKDKVEEYSETALKEISSPDEIVGIEELGISLKNNEES